MISTLKGIFPAVASPCNEDEVFLEETFAKLVSSLCGESIGGVYVCGVTGDGYRMSLAERKRAAEIAVAAAKRPCKAVIVHVGASNTRHAICLAEHAAKTEATAVSSIAPVNCDQEQLITYYRDIAVASGLPVLVYHFPAFTHRSPTLDDVLALLDIEGVVGVKATDWNMFFVKQLSLARPEKMIFSGYDETLVPALLYGACGGIGSWYNVFPKSFVQIWESVRAGQLAEAMRINEQILMFLDLASKCGVRPVFEYLLKEAGFGPLCWRRPRSQLQAAIPPEMAGMVESIRSCERLDSTA